MDSELRPLSSSFIYYKKITNQKLSKGEKNGNKKRVCHKSVTHPLNKQFLHQNY